MEDNSKYLTGKILIAMPSLPDPRFSKAIVLICGHDDNGAMGLIINRPLLSLTFNELLQNLKIESHSDYNFLKLYFGGPVEMGRGFVLHSPDYRHESTLSISPLVQLTATSDILRAIVNGEGPRKALLSLGYSGWGSGQLEKEIVANGWLVSDLDDSILFDVDVDQRWGKSLINCGIRPEALSLEGGSA